MRLGFLKVIPTMNPIPRYSLLPLFSLILRFLTLTAEPISSFSLQGLKFGDSNSEFAVLGDAQIANGSSLVNLTTPSSGSGSGSGQIVYNKPFKLFDSNSSKPVSFSTDFTFTIFPADGDGVAFVIFPSGELSKVFGKGLFGISEKLDSKFLAIEYNTRKDGNHIGVDVGSFVSVEVSNVSSLGLLLNGGQPLKSWIDYEASSKRLEIRLGKTEAEKPYQPLISHSIDLSKMWGGKEVMVGITSNSSQTSSLSSWSFSIRTVPNSMHSQPLDPMAPLDEHHQEIPRKKSCFLTILGTLIFATGCGTLVAFCFLFLWVVFFGSHSTVAPEMPMNPMECKYDKVNVTVDNSSDDHNSAN